MATLPFGAPVRVRLGGFEPGGRQKPAGRSQVEITARNRLLFLAEGGGPVQDHSNRSGDAFSCRVGFAPGNEEPLTVGRDGPWRKVASVFAAWKTKKPRVEYFLWSAPFEFLSGAADGC